MSWLHKDRRAQPRQEVSGLGSRFGQLTDLSSSGASFFRKGSPIVVGSTLKLLLEGPGVKLTLKGRVVREQAMGLRRNLYGIEFIDLKDDERQLLKQLMKDAGTDQSPTAWTAA